MDTEEINTVGSTTSKKSKLFNKKECSLCIKLQGLEDERNDINYHNAIFWYPLQAITGLEQSEVNLEKLNSLHYRLYYMNFLILF